MCDFTSFSSTKPAFGILVSKLPGMKRVPLRRLAVPWLIADRLFVWLFDKASGENACSPSWVGIIQSIAAGIVFGLVKPLFKIIVGSQIGCSGALKSSSVTYSTVQVVAMSV